MAATTSATWYAMDSSAARASAGAVVPRVTPVISPTARASHHGAPRPLKPGTRRTPSLDRRPPPARRAAGVDAEQVGQPAQRRARRADVALGGEGRCRPTGQATVRHRPASSASGVDEAHHRGAGAEGGLDLPGREGPVGEQGGMGVAHHGVHGTPSGRGSRPLTAGNGPVDGTTRGRAARGMPNRSRRSAIPVDARTSSSWVREALPASMTCSPPNRREQPAVDRAEADLAGRARARDRIERVEQPARLGRGEHRVERQAAALADEALAARASAVVAAGGGALVLPGQQRRQRLAASPVPERRSDSRCVHEADGDHRCAVAAGQAGARPHRGRSPRSRRASCSTQPGRGWRLADGRAAARDDRARCRRRAGLGGARALVDGEDVAGALIRLGHELRAAAAMPAAFEPEVVEQERSRRRWARSPGCRGCASGPGAAGRRARPPRRRGRPRVVASSTVTMRAVSAAARRSVSHRAADRRDIEDACSNAARRELSGRVERARNHGARGHDGDVVAARAGSIGRPSSKLASSGVTSGTLKRPTRKERAGRASAAQRTAARVCAGSAGTTTVRLAMARIQARSSIEWCVGPSSP